MGWIGPGLIGAPLAPAGCESDAVRCAPHAAAEGDGAGTPAVRERVAEETAAADIWREVAAPTSSPVSVTAPPGATCRAGAFADAQQAEVAGQRWRLGAGADDGGTADDQLRQDHHLVPAGATCAGGLRCRPARAPATGDEPRQLILSIADRGSIAAVRQG